MTVINEELHGSEDSLKDDTSTLDDQKLAQLDNGELLKVLYSREVWGGHYYGTFGEKV